MAVGVGGSFGSVGGTDFVEDIADVARHRVQADHQCGGDLLVTLAVSDQTQNFDFAGR